MITTSYGRKILQDSKQKYCLVTLLCSAFAGCGVLFATKMGEPYFLLMRRAICQPVSIVGSTVALLLPFLLILFLITYSKPWLVYIFCTLPIFHFTAIGCAIASIFGTAGWLIRILFQFSDFLLIPIVVYLGIVRLNDNLDKSVILQSIILICIVGALEYLWISPFLVELFETYEAMGR